MKKRKGRGCAPPDNKETPRLQAHRRLVPSCAINVGWRIRHCDRFARVPQKLVSAIALCTFTVVLLPAQSASAKRAITEKDLFDFQWIGDAQLSPDGSRVAFVKVNVNPKHTGYETSLWTLDLKSASASPVRLTHGPQDSFPRWSPDGRELAFVRVIEKDGKPEPGQIYLLPLSGGEPHPVTSLPGGATSPSLSPDGKYLLFTSKTSPEDIAKAERAKSGAKEEEHQSDVRVITRAMYRMNGVGYLDFNHPTHLWVLDLPAAGAEPGKPRQLTSGRFSEAGPVWSPDSKSIYFTADKKDEPYYDPPETELDRVPPTGGEPAKVLGLPFRASEISISPDGARAAFHAATATPVRSYTQPDLWVVDLKSGAVPKNLTHNYDFDIGGEVGGDNRAPRASGSSGPLWSADGKTILDIVGKEGCSNLVHVDAVSGNVTELTHGQQAVQFGNQSADGADLIALVSTPVNVGDLFSIAEDGTQKQLTNINAKLFSQMNLTMPDEVWFKSFDGRRIQTWIQKPPDFDPSKKYPLILNIHGGPHSAYGWVFDHEFQWMAAKGYVVVYPNPRGSTTYGQDFGNLIQHKYPGDDFRDLMLAVDETIKRGYIDTERLGVTGGSGGGVLTDWTITHTNRFKAAVSQRDISDWTSWWYTDDFLLFQPTWFKGAPFNEPEDFKSRSAMTYVKQIRTPMMFILGEADYRTPPTSGGEQLFRALKYMKEPTVMVRFPGESHELSRSGQPWHRIERLQHIVGWFDKYLDGMNKPEYDIVPGVVPQPAPHSYESATPTTVR
jgi:dipeptidyl aminopeptidase/acylaminoacyl peptidase